MGTVTPLHFSTMKRDFRYAVATRGAGDSMISVPRSLAASAITRSSSVTYSMNLVLPRDVIRHKVCGRLAFEPFQISINPASVNTFR